MYRRVISILLIIGLIVSIFPAPAEIQAAPPEEKSVSAHSFRDVQNHWAGDAATKLAGEGILNGNGDGLFHPDAPITRAEFMAIVNRVFHYTDKGESTFSDVSASAWYADDLLKGHEAGIVDGYANGQFMPKTPVQRQDGFLMLSRAFHLEASPEKDLTSLSDGDKVASYARTAAESMVAAGYVKGDSAKKLNPRGAMTRAEAAVILNQMIGWVSPGAGEFSLGEIKGNAIVNRSGVVLKNSRISGVLYVTEGVGEGELKADHVTVSGNTWISGGGVHSVNFEHSTLAAVILDKKSGFIRLSLGGTSSASNVVVKHKATIEVSAGSTVTTMTIGPDASGSSIVNKGVIGLLEVDADGVLLDGLPVNKGSRLKLPALSATPAPASAAPGSTTSVSTSAPTSTPASTPTTTPSSPPEGNDAWKLVWNDEFNGGSIDTSKWNIEDTGTVYNNELEYYRPDNAAIQEESGNSVLALEAKNEVYQGRNYTSAKLTSKMKGDWTYGKFTVRAKLPIQQGMWPAIWMMPTDDMQQYGPWPGSGEMDIMELTGPKASDPENKDKYPRTVHGSLHYNIPHVAKSEKYVLPQGQTFADDYHEFTLEWLPGLICYYVDGEKYFETSDWGTQAAGQPDFYTYPAPFDRPFYMILNLAVGGDWPENPQSDFQSDKMYVDYVRVYEYKDLNLWPDVTGKRPENSEPVTAQRSPLPDGNQIYNGNFAGGTDSSGVPEDWQFIVNAGGQGSASVVNDPDKGTVAKVAVDSAGTQNYSLQLTQMPLLLEKGKAYKVTFEAKADAPRPFMTKLTEFGGGWTAYSKEQNLQLTDQWQHYEYTFTMKEPSDNNARFEFNLGQNEVAAYFTNVKVVETDPVEETRKPLDDGNLIYNGTFDLGKDRMEYWNFNAVPEAVAVATVTNKLIFPQMERKFNASIQNDGVDANAVTLSQSDLPLTPGTTYQLTFEGKAEQNLPIQIALDAGTDNIIYPDGSVINLTAETKSYNKEISVGENAAETGTLSFLLGRYAGLVEIDNVRLIPIQNPSSLGGYIHLPADNYWDTSGTQLVSSGESNKDISGMEAGDYVDYKVKVTADGTFVPMVRVASVQADAKLALDVLDISLQTVVTAATYREVIGSTGGQQTYRTVTGNPLKLPAGTYYIRLSGHDYNLAWLDLSRELVLNGGFDNGDMGGWTLFKKDWDDSDPVKDTVASAVSGGLEVSLGGTGDEPWNVQVKQPAMKLEKGKTYRLSFTARSSQEREILALVQHDGTNDNNWSTYLEQTVRLSGEDARYEYIFTVGNDELSAVLQFSLGKISEILGAHTVDLDNISLLRINPVLAGLPYGENLLPNGDFSSGIAGWSTYSTDSGQLSILSKDESLQIDVASVGSNSWDRQVYYEGIAYNQGNRYTLTFKAKATAARGMNVSIGWLDSANNYTWHSYTSKVIDLTTDEQIYTIEFNVDSDSTTIGRISFELGNIDGGASSNQSVYIDDINLVNNGVIPE